MDFQLTETEHLALKAEVLREVERRAKVIASSNIPDRHVLNEVGQWVPYHPGQDEAWNSIARFVFVFAGSQGGKTMFGPRWLLREIQRCGRGDYLAATSTYDLFKLKMLPAMRALFEDRLGIAKYWAGSKVLELCEPGTMRFWARDQNDPMWGRIILRSAQSEGGLESSTAKAAWLDECGMDEFGITAWEAVQRRLSIHLGRVLGTTTLYNLGWLKTQVWSRFREGDKDYDCVSFASDINPAFPKEEFERVTRTMPRWKVNMFYRGVFDVPEGLIYSCFDSDTDTCDDFAVPADWPLWGGMDFGGVHMAAVLFAERPADKHLFLVNEYLTGGVTTAAHAIELMTWGARRWWGGAASEDQWRREFGACGMPILRPVIPEVEIGIDTVYSQMAEKRITVFKSCIRWLDEAGTYSRATDKAGQVTEKIANKEMYHLMDSTRYVIGSIRKRGTKAKVVRLGG